eukprot:gene11617-24321_t
MIKSLRNVPLLTRRFSSYPAHKVVGLPTLSPTMATGNIAKWLKKEGDSLSAGDAIAEVETDKTTVTFEALDDAYIAKILAKEGEDIAVGAPIMILVEEQESLGKFADFKVPSSPTAAPKSVAPTPIPVKAAETTPVKASPAASPATPPVKVETKTATISSPSPAAVAPVSVPQNASAPVERKGSVSVLWGTGASKSGLASKLASDQQEYIKKFGSTGHIPLKIKE